jgi:hypothetical protein
VRRVIRSFDALVRRVQGVFEFSTDSDCILRLRRTRLPRDLSLAEGLFPAGTPVLELHLWNERVPPLPPTGPDLAWASQATQRLRRSLRDLAGHVQVEPSWRDTRLLGGTTILVDGPSAELLLRRLGFELLPHARPRRCLLEAWQNLYALGLMAAFNPLSVRGRSPASLRRTDLWMSMDSFLRRYALTSGPSPRQETRERGEG